MNWLKISLKHESDRIYANISPYYTPSNKENKAIVQAYWEAYIKNWTNYSIEMTEANDEKYSFTVTYNWGEPDMEELNKKNKWERKSIKKRAG